MTDWKALCAALVDEAPYESPTTCLARAALAQQHVSQPYKLPQPEPQGPTDEELDELWAEIDGGGAIWAWQYFARAVLARWGHPVIQPEPVAPTDEELYELWNSEGIEADFQDCRRFARAYAARWGRPTSEENLDG